MHATTRGMHFKAIGKEVLWALPICHDNGSQYISNDLQDEIAWPGIESSLQFVLAQRFIRTFKEPVRVENLSVHQEIAATLSAIQKGI